jgi:hypothetical protein
MVTGDHALCVLIDTLKTLKLWQQKNRKPQRRKLRSRRGEEYQWGRPQRGIVFLFLAIGED